MPDVITALLCAIEHQRAGRLPQAQALLQDALLQDPDNPSALFLLGTTRLALGHAEEAASLLARAVRLRPGHRPQRQAFARALIKANRPADALDALAPLAQDRTLAEIQFLRGTALNALGRPQDAAAALADAVAAAPHHADAHLNLGNALIDLNEADAAEAHMRRPSRSTQPWPRPMPAWASC